MEHEVFVPVPVERLREALDDPARVARAVPGLQHEADAEPVTGRLKVRIGSHSITYRGAVRVSRRDDGSYAVEGEGVEARGTGAVKLGLRLTPRAAEGGATLTVHGTVTAGGRVAELPPDAVTSAVARLLNRFAANLGMSTGTTGETPVGETSADGEPAGEPPVGEAPAGETPAEEAPAGETPAEEAPAGETPAEGEPAGEPPVGEAPAGGMPAGEAPAGETSAEEPPAPEPPSASSAPSVFDAEKPSPAIGPELRDDADDANETAEETVDGAAGPAGGADGADDSVDAYRDRDRDADADEDTVAEAAHARRTMIGRSAEEVDHAPPRGRYAPVPGPQTVSAAPLRWAAPAAALAVASAIVAVRALRRRR
ncbi:SRPBCC domain-containing protein [Streptomyces sp. NEAU-W12]|uniref:SRPBCC domain-containing protein n=1 Tax=Streptomyces sp. NEAU-W12 TaxID=2994668 RepID=UPI00224A6E4E|nr:SRPBCC domain-containing protein [Streptomyces sp. NEAU-W12]MCX2922387.1 SRPBCC domain-containing protein [Streptomyces sp. NEAU-W12]